MNPRTLLSSQITNDLIEELWENDPSMKDRNKKKDDTRLYIELDRQYGDGNLPTSWAAAKNLVKMQETIWVAKIQVLSQVRNP